MVNYKILFGWKSKFERIMDSKEFE